MPSSVVYYSCDECNRTAGFVTAGSGSNVLRRCTITHQCRGTMRPSLDTHEPRSLPVSSALQDWAQQNTLYVHRQLIPATVWEVRHGMGAVPNIHAYTTTGLLNQALLTPAVPLRINPVSQDVTVLEFATAVAGEAHAVSLLVPRSTSQQIASSEDTIRSLLSATSIAFATAGNTDSAVSLDIRGSLSLSVEILGVAPGVVGGPWGGVRAVLYQGRTHTTRSINLETNAVTAPLYTRNLIREGDEITISVPSADSGVLLLSTPPHVSSGTRLITTVAPLPATMILGPSGVMLIAESGTRIATPPVNKVA